MTKPPNALHGVKLQESYIQGYYYPANGSVEALEYYALYMALPSPESYPEADTLRVELN